MVTGLGSCVWVWCFYSSMSSHVTMGELIIHVLLHKPNFQTSREKERKKHVGTGSSHMDHLLIHQLATCQHLGLCPLVHPSAIALALAVGSLANDPILCSVLLWKHSALTQRPDTKSESTRNETFFSPLEENSRNLSQLTAGFLFECTAVILVSLFKRIKQCEP